MTAQQTPAKGLVRKLFNQLLLMLAGYGGAQVLGFARNVLLAHLLSKNDFGVAAALTVTLQVFEMVSDLAVDRLILQAPDGAGRKLIDGAHTLLMVRAVIIGTLLWLTAPLLAQLFGLVEATAAFQAVALIPLVKGAMHLDWRRAQRQLDNRAAVVIEALPQAVGVVAVWPAVWLTHDYSAALWVAGVQAAAATLVSHALADTPYRLSLDQHLLRRFLAFGWPIVISAIPLLAVFQGDRMIVVRYLGAEALAGYTAAFLVTMVPATLAVKVGMSLILPLLSDTTSGRRTRNERFLLLSELTVLSAALYLVGFATLGGSVVRIAFGASYDGYGAVTAAVAMAWALRLVQMPVGALFMAVGDNKPVLVAGIVRALALIPALAAAHWGASLPVLGLCAAAGELASLLWLARAVRGIDAALPVTLLSRAAFLGLPIVVTLPFWSGHVSSLPLTAAVSLACLISVFVIASAAFLLPETRQEIRARLDRFAPA